jgi:hypothetical protein
MQNRRIKCMIPQRLGTDIQETMMNMRFKSLALLLATGCQLGMAAEGLQLPAAEAVWPHWQARITLQTASAAPLPAKLSSGLIVGPRGDGNATTRLLQSASVIGDYYFATPSFGNFRASGGLLMGASNSTPLTGSFAPSRLGVALNNNLGSPAPGSKPGPDSTSPATYLGLGFSAAAWHSHLAFSADVGLLAERPGGALSAGRALLGNQGAENALRELRLSPLFQLGVRYSF